MFTSLTLNLSCWASSCWAVASRSRMLSSVLGAAAPQTALQLLLRGGQQEDRGGPGVHPADVGRAVHVDDQHHHLACFEAPVHLFLQGAVVVAVVKIMLHHLIGSDELLELLAGAVIVIHALLLPGTGGTGGGRNGLLDLGVSFPQRGHHAVLAGACRTRDHKQILLVFHLTAPLLSLFPPAGPEHGWPPSPAAAPKGPHGRNP